MSGNVRDVADGYNVAFDAHNCYPVESEEAKLDIRV